MAVNREKTEARMDSLNWQPDREDLGVWIEMSPVLAESQRRNMLTRFREGGTVLELIEVFQEEYELDEGQMDDWYHSMENAMDEYVDNKRFLAATYYSADPGD